MDKFIVYVKSSYQRDLCPPSLVIVYQVSYNKKRKGIKPINGKVGQKISSSVRWWDAPIALWNLAITTTKYENIE